jgi:hypothetical protein
VDINASKRWLPLKNGCLDLDAFLSCDGALLVVVPYRDAAGAVFTEDYYLRIPWSDTPKAGHLWPGIDLTAVGQHAIDTFFRDFFSFHTPATLTDPDEIARRVTRKRAAGDMPVYDADICRRVFQLRGAVYLAERYAGKKSLVLLGPSNSGKTLFKGLMQKVEGPGMAKDFDPSWIGMPFETSQAVNARILNLNDWNNDGCVKLSPPQVRCALLRLHCSLCVTTTIIELLWHVLNQRCVRACIGRLLSQDVRPRGDEHCRQECKRAAERGAAVSACAYVEPAPVLPGTGPVGGVCVRGAAGAGCVFQQHV